LSYEQIRYEVDGRVLVLTLNRPDKLNAFTGQMQEELCDALARAQNDDGIRALVFTGAGRAYCAGADLSKRDQTFNRAGHATAPRDGGGLLTLEIFKLRKPVIAAINGPAVGIGITMTLPMDVRLAAKGARMGFVFTRRGVVPEACSTYFLPRVVGMSRATEWMLTGRVFDAQEALAGGLVSRVVEPDELLPAALALGREIADNTAPVSVALTRQMLWRGLAADHPMEAHRLESQGLFHLGQGPDAAEGVVSFLEKRPPRFQLSASRDMPPYYPWFEEPHY
jgi:enoyl-CoA hydratase/carnithine racemase